MVGNCIYKYLLISFVTTYEALNDKLWRTNLVILEHLMSMYYSLFIMLQYQCLRNIKKFRRLGNKRIFDFSGAERGERRDGKKFA